jgi:hypothetical protein
MNFKILNIFQQYCVLILVKAALGRIILTPPDIIGGYIGRHMAGYTPVPRCKGKYDDIYGYALLLEETVLGNIPKRMILISLDYCQVPLMFTEYIKDKSKMHTKFIRIKF